MPASHDSARRERKPVRVAVNAAAAPPDAPRAAAPSATGVIAAAVASPPVQSDEASLLLSVAGRFTAEGRATDAVALVERVLLRRPELRADPRVSTVLLRTAQGEDTAAANAAFTLLSGPMAEHGAKTLYELWLSPNSKAEARRRAEKWLQSRDFDKVAPLPLYVSVKLRQAKTCEDKHALLSLASAGDNQTLHYLKEIEKRTTCALDDLANCYPCMRVDSRLAETIAQLEAQAGG